MDTPDVFKLFQSCMAVVEAHIKQYTCRAVNKRIRTVFAKQWNENAFAVRTLTGQL